MNFFKETLILLVKTYQHCIALMMPSSCRFVPSCSNYALEAIQSYGIRRGLLLTSKRLLKCHPFHKGGIDLVPPLT